MQEKVPRKIFYEKAFLKITQKSRKNTCARVSF